MKGLILGGGGFIGSHICDALVGEGWEVRVFERPFRRRDNVAHLIGRVSWFEGDFSNSSDIAAALDGIDVVFHLISTTIPKTSNENPLYDLTSNVCATLSFLNEAVRAGVKKIVFMSSGGTVYGIPTEIPIPESHQTEPVCAYGIHKLAIEKYLALYSRNYGLDYAVIRLSNPYGPRMNPLSAQGAIPVFMYRALKGQNIEIWGDGSIVRDYLYITDVARAVCALASYSGGEKIFNIGSGIGMSLNDVLKGIEDVIGAKLDIRYTESRKFDVPANVLDIARVMNEIAWSPQIDFKEGLRRTYDFLKSHP